MCLYWRVGKEASNSEVSERNYLFEVTLTANFILSYISSLEDRIKRLESPLMREEATLSEGSPVGYTLPEIVRKPPLWLTAL